MTYKLFIDDERFPVSDDFVIARSSDEAISVVLDKGLPIYISFDHDLGGEDTSMRFVKWFAEHVLFGEASLDEAFDFYVHSQNPVGKKNIEAYMQNFLNCLEE